MDEQNSPLFSLQLRQGNILLFEDGWQVHFEVGQENHTACLLTPSDSEELMNILTGISKSIWENPGYVKEPYTGQLYRMDETGAAYWTINGAKLSIGLNEQQDAVAIYCEGDPAFKLSVNQAVEIIQVLAHFSKQAR